MTPEALSAPSIAARIAALPQQPWPELKAEWARLFGGEPPGHSRRFVEKRIAYRWQEIEFRKADRICSTATGAGSMRWWKPDLLGATGLERRQSRARC